MHRSIKYQCQIIEVSQVQACEDDAWQNYLLPYPSQPGGHSGCGVVQDRKACLFPLMLSYNYLAFLTHWHFFHIHMMSLELYKQFAKVCICLETYLCHIPLLPLLLMMVFHPLFLPCNDFSIVLVPYELIQEMEGLCCTL